MNYLKLISALLSMVIFGAVSFGQEAPADTPPVAGPEIAAKPAGTIRIGIVSPKLTLGQESSTTEAANALRDAMTSYLKGPTVDVVVIEAKSATNAGIEAGQKGCDFILFTSVSKKAKASLFGSLIKAAVPVVASQLPGPPTETSSESGDIKKTITDGGNEFINKTIASKFGAKDEITLDFVLTGPDWKSVTEKGSSSAKVKTDGDDILTTLVEQITEKILHSAIKK